MNSLMATQKTAGSFFFQFMSKKNEGDPKDIVAIKGGRNLLGFKNCLKKTVVFPPLFLSCMPGTLV